MTTLSRLALLLVAILVVLPFGALGQSTDGPTLLVTWQAESYAPADYTGHSLAAAGSPVVASAMLVDDGHIINLDGTLIYWYVDGNLVESGVGKQSIRIYAQTIARAAIKVRAQIPSYRGNIVLKTVTIRSVEPDVVIDAPFANGIISGDRSRIRALPYFFNIQDPLKLVYEWSVAGQGSDSENPNVLDLVFGGSYADGQRVPISVSVRNPDELFEQAQSYITLTYRQ